MKHIRQTTLAMLRVTLALIVSSPLYSVAAETKAPERAIVTKARSIVLPEFKLDGVTLSEALLQLRTAAKQNDPESKGFNFMATKPAVAAANPKFTLALKNVTLLEATERVAKAAGVSVSARDYAFAFDLKSDKP
jgi:hypothetical protein